MEVIKFVAEVVNSKHPVKNYHFKRFQIDDARIYCYNFELVHNAANINNIHSIWFDHCVLAEFPRAEILLDLVKNLTSIAIRDSNLTQITGENLRGLGLLKELYLSFNSIETLPKGLFVHTPNLEIVSLWRNRIKKIDENILDPLKNLKYFDLSDNLEINVWFDSINNEGNVTLIELKEKIKKCRPTEEIINDLKREIAEMKLNDEMTKKEIAALRTNCVKLTAELNQLKSTNVKPLDFSVVVNGKDFHVNKDTLATNSPVLAKLIRENHDADRLVLENVSGETFEEILNFMMTKNTPDEAANLIEIYAASARLEMKDLMELTAKILMDKVTPENALRIVIMCEKFKHKELSKKALIELNKKFAEQ